MKGKLKVVNMIMTGEFPFHRRLNDREINRIVERGRLRWEYLEEALITSPRLILRIERDELNSSGKKKHLQFELKPSGKIFANGVKTKKEVEEIYQEVFSELKKLCPKVLG